MRVIDRRQSIAMTGAGLLLSAIDGSASRAAVSVGLSTGMVFPDVIYRTEDGQAKSVSASRGKVTLVYFWAVWCPICFNDIVNVQNMHDHLKANPGFSSIALNIMDEYKPGVSWARARKITLPLGDSGIGSRGTPTAVSTPAGPFMLPRTTPQFYVLDRNGIVSYAVEGRAAGTQPNLDAIQKLLARPT
jgi:Redoxin